MLLLAQKDPLQAAVRELDPVDVIAHESGAKTLRLGAKLTHHLRPHDPLRIAGVVLDVGRVLQLPTPMKALKDEWLKVGPGRVERRRIPGRPAADDDHVLNPLILSQNLAA